VPNVFARYTIAAAVLSFAACAGQQPPPSTQAVACAGERVVIVRVSTDGVLDIYAVTPDGGDKTRLGEVQSGSTTLPLPRGAPTEFIAETQTRVHQVVAASRGYIPAVPRNPSVTFELSCR
jgi:hypothetical protein